MPTVRDQAIIIRQWDWSETSQTVSLFCRDHGVHRGLAKGARREKGRFSGGLELLTRGQIIAIVKPTTDLATLTEWDLQEIFPRLRQDLRAHRAAMCVADILHHVLQPADAHPSLWDATLHTLRALEKGADPDRALLWFQWRLLDDAGFRPDVRRVGRIGASAASTPALAFDPQRGALRTLRDDGSPAQRQWRVRPGTANVLQMLDAQDQDSIDTAEVRSVEGANRLLAAYLRWVLGREPPALRFVLGEGPLANRRTSPAGQAGQAR